MDIFGKKKEKERNDFLIQVYAVCKEISGSLRRIQKELDNDRICGHWVNEVFSVSVFKMNFGYMISISRNEVLHAQLTVIPDGDELRINDSDAGTDMTVRYFEKTRELFIDGFGSFSRDFEKRQSDERDDICSAVEKFLGTRQEPVLPPEIYVTKEPEKMSWEEYRDTFLRASEKPLLKRACLSVPVYERIRNILPQMDVTLTVSAYVENIVLNHLKAFEDSINRWVE